jgi:hypothetical protein
VPLAEDFGKHRQSFLGTILLVAGEEDKVLALARALFSLVGHPVLAACRCEQKADKKETAQSMQMHGRFLVGFLPRL